jgi:hypothetical protein
MFQDISGAAVNGYLRHRVDVVRVPAARVSVLRPPTRAAGHVTGHGRRRCSTIAKKLSGWPKICKLVHAFLWEHSCERLKLAQSLRQLGVFLTYF